MSTMPLLGGLPGETFTLAEEAYAWCYWPDRTARLSQIVDGHVAEPLAVVKRDGHQWTWECYPSRYELPHFGSEPTRSGAIEAARLALSRPVALPPWHPARQPR